MADDGPKYMQVYRVLQQRLKSGHYPVGGRMPTESELSKFFAVSRITMRRALDMLVQDGYVESRQGSGYRVVTLSPATDTCMTSFTDAMMRAGHDPRSRLLSIDHMKEDDPRLDPLPADLRTVPLTVVNRLRLVDDDPRMLVMTYAPTALLHDARPEDFPETGPGQSILRILSTRFNIDWSAACEDIMPVAASDEVAKILNVSPGTPLLKQACSAFDEAGAMTFYEEVIRTGMVSFNLSQKSRQPRHVTED